MQMGMVLFIEVLGAQLHHNIASSKTLDTFIAYHGNLLKNATGCLLFYNRCLNMQDLPVSSHPGQVYTLAMIHIGLASA